MLYKRSIVIKATWKQKLWKVENDPEAIAVGKAFRSFQ